MSTMFLAMSLQQESDLGGMQHLFLLMFVLIAVVICVMAIILIVIGLKALKVIKEVGVLGADIKVKFMPLLDEVMAISKTSRTMLEDAAPKIKTISENLRKTSETLVETSGVAKSAMVQVHGTITDANLRTQRQVARVDHMVSAALTTTQELADTISNGIRVPAMKLAGMFTQVKLAADGLMAKVKGMGGASPSGNWRGPE